jgi:hypothetical protein
LLDGLHELVSNAPGVGSHLREETEGDDLQIRPVHAPLDQPLRLASLNPGVGLSFFSEAVVRDDSQVALVRLLQDRVVGVGPARNSRHSIGQLVCEMPADGFGPALSSGSKHVGNVCVEDALEVEPLIHESQ